MSNQTEEFVKLAMSQARNSKPFWAYLEWICQKIAETKDVDIIAWNILEEELLHLCKYQLGEIADWKY
jgi:hypothetical protein